MSSSQMTYVIAVLALIFMFGGIMGFVLLDLQDFLNKNSGAPIISSEEEFAQLVAYSATKAYACSEEAGGRRSNSLTSNNQLWASYQEYRSAGVFDDLEEAMPYDLQCSGSATTLPMTSEGFWDSLGGVTGLNTKSWRNDEEGKYSRNEFIINNSDDATPLEFNKGCIAYDSTNNENDMAFAFVDSSDLSFMNWKVSGGISNCFGIADGGTESKDSGNGAFMTVPVIFHNVEGNTDTILPSSSLTQYSVGSGSIPHLPQYTTTVTERELYLCRGTKGYVQTNNGAMDADVVKRGNPDDPDYSVSRPPGYSDREQPGRGAADNTIHPYIVITDMGRCS